MVGVSSGHDEPATGDELIAAATVILLRDSGTGPELLMVQRDRSLAFAGGAWVFPGGRVDPVDVELAGGDPVNAEIHAAVRECAEEAGLAVGATDLVRWSHWTPPPQEQRRRFSTAFFVAPAPDGEVVIDNGEIRGHRWTTAANAIELHRCGTIDLTPPTYITLCQLLGHDYVGTILAQATSRSIEHFATRIAIDGGDILALYHGDAGYESGDPSAEGPRHRLIMRAGDWVYLRDAG